MCKVDVCSLLIFKWRKILTIYSNPSLDRILNTLEQWIYAILLFMHLLVDPALNDGAEKMRCCDLFFGLQYVVLFGCCHHAKFKLK